MATTGKAKGRYQPTMSRVEAGGGGGRVRLCIGRVRLPPVERAKMRPLLEDGGVQLRARFEHHRYADYASTRSLGGVEEGVGLRDRDCGIKYNCETPLRNDVGSPSLSAKSCDNIFSRHWSSCAPQLWRESTRSEEALCGMAQDSSERQALTSARSMGNVGSLQSTSAKARLAAFLKKLSPRGLRRSRSQPSTAADASVQQCPWLLVEFSAHDLESGAGSRDSGGSDCSFDLAVSESQQRKEEHLRKLQGTSEDICRLTGEIPSSLLLQSKLIAPKIVIASPGSSMGHSVASTACSTNIAFSLIQSNSQPVSPIKPRLKPKPALVQGGGSYGGTASEDGARPRPGSEEDVRGGSITGGAAAIARGGAGGGGRSAPAPRPRTAPPPPPAGSLPSSPRRRTCAAPDFAPDATPAVKMTSLDSIGSCSLDAYASSSESTDPFLGPKQHTGINRVSRENGIHSHDHELASACALCSISEKKLPTATSVTSKFNATCESPEYVRRTVRLFEEQDQQPSDDTEFSSLPSVKKPSYLGISCSLSGYSSLTSYDSKVREGFRTRDKSPAPPPPRLLSSMSNKGAPNGVQSAHEMSHKTPDSPPREKQRNQSAPSGTHSGGRQSQILPNCGSSQDSIQMDETDLCTSSRKSKVPNNTTEFDQTKVSLNTSSTIGVSTPLRRSPGTVRITEFTCQTKSFVQTKLSSCEMQQVNSSIESYGGIARTNGVYSDEPNIEIPANNEGGGSFQECSPKSFVQQRIERLYGPGALAQGFISRVRRMSSLDDSLNQVSSKPSVSSGSPQLPVLRHLRPEFRAQLPLTPTAVSKAQGQCGLPRQSVPTVSRTNQKSSNIALADYQPAAPDVPVIKAESSLLLSESRGNVDSHHAPVIAMTSSYRTEGNYVVTDKSNEDTRVTPTEPLHEEPCCIEGEEEKNGHHFLKVLHKEIDRLSDLANQAEHELYNIDGLSEDVQGKLRSASGQARLLTKQKLKQFEGLCNKNISQCPGEAFPTTAQDLEGFWDMVKLQIDHVDQLFADIDVLRKHNWKENTEYPTNSGSTNGSRRRQSTRHSTTKHCGSVSTSSLMSSGARTKGSSSTSDKKKSDSVRQSREEQALARKKLMEERRQALKAQQAKAEQHVEIYVAPRNGK